MAEYLTAEECRQRSGMAFFEKEGRLERVMELVGSVVSTDRDEVWVSADDAGSSAVEGGRILGVRVVVSYAVRPGQVRLWSDSRKGWVR